MSPLNLEDPYPDQENPFSLEIMDENIEAAPAWIPIASCVNTCDQAFMEVEVVDRRDCAPDTDFTLGDTLAIKDPDRGYRYFMFLETNYGTPADVYDLTRALVEVREQMRTAGVRHLAIAEVPVFSNRVLIHQVMHVFSHVNNSEIKIYTQ